MTNPLSARNRLSIPALLVAVALVPASMSCTAPGSDGESAEVPEPAPVEQDGAAGSDPARAGAATEREAAEEDDEVETPEEEAARLHAPALALDAVMVELGWQRSGAASAEAFVVSPDGTQTVAGRYRQGSREVTVAVFVYPNDRFASPHAVDLRERMLLVPGGIEGGLHSGRLVVHVRGQDGESTREVLGGLSEALSVPVLEAR